MKGKIPMAAVGLALAMSTGGRLSAKSDVTFDDTLKWIDKHRSDLRAEWHTVEGPTKWQQEDFQKYSGMQDWYWDRTVKWTAKSECPRLEKGLATDGETYSITRAVSFVGLESDISEQPTTKDANYTEQTQADYTWRLRVSQISPDPIVLEYREYLHRVEQPDDRTVDVGTYYYVCIVPRPDADPDAVTEIENDQKIDDGRGNIKINKGHRLAVSIAPIATVRDKKMAERLANAVGHLINLLQTQKSPKEAF
jgi:hypothetical protein